MIGLSPRHLHWIAAAAILACLGNQAQAGTPEAETPDLAFTASAGEPYAMARWVVASGDAAGRPFIIVDKLAARVLAFESDGTLIGDTAALLGLAVGDISAPGIGTMRLADIGPPLRITPAGRFDAHLGRNLTGATILWVDYEEALSLHAVVTSNVRERRMGRLETPSTDDNRISYGCINVPTAFFADIVEPLFSSDNGIVYILPEAPQPG